MNLKNIVLGATLALGLGACATTSIKRTCYDKNLTMTCVKKTEDVRLAYNHGSYAKPGVCSVLYKNDKKGFMFALEDFGCDGTVDYATLNFEDAKGDQWRNTNEELFKKKLDPLFQRLKKEALEVDKK